jgi:hypothetical protein
MAHRARFGGVSITHERPKGDPRVTQEKTVGVPVIQAQCRAAPQHDVSPRLTQTHSLSPRLDPRSPKITQTHPRLPGDCPLAPALTHFHSLSPTLLHRTQRCGWAGRRDREAGEAGEAAAQQRRFKVQVQASSLVPRWLVACVVEALVQARRPLSLVRASFVSPFVPFLRQTTARLSSLACPQVLTAHLSAIRGCAQNQQAVAVECEWVPVSPNKCARVQLDWVRTRRLGVYERLFMSRALSKAHCILSFQSLDLSWVGPRSWHIPHGASSLL